MMEINSREIAILLWSGGLLLWASWKSKDLRKSLGGVLRAVSHHKILIPCAIAGAYAAACVILLWKFGFWESANLKTTLLWLLTFAFVTMGEVVQSEHGVKKLKAVVKDTLSATAVVLFIGEFHTFPLWAELLLVPSLVVVGLMLAMAERMPEHTIVLKPLRFIQSAAGLSILGYSLLRIAQDMGGFATVTTGREFAVPILLSLMFLPFLYGLMLYAAYENAAVRLRFSMKDGPLGRYAFWRGLISFRTDIDLFRRFVRDLGLHDVDDQPTVNRMIRDLRNLKQRESNPPAVPWSLGWSPYQAAAFLSAHDLATKDYHRSFGGWWAESPMKRIGGGLFHDHLTYRIFGNEEAATRLKLVLNANLPGTPDQSDAAFQLTALALTEKALGLSEREQLETSWDTLSTAPLQFGDVIALLAHDAWGSELRGGYERRFELRHAAHVADGWETS